MEQAFGDRLAERWRLWVLLVWLAAAGLLVYARWNGIHWFSLGDTDDNLRIMQVRALLAGQDWFDLRQYRLAPPGGADVHWSRLVDLPIAGIKLALSPLVGGAAAETAAVAVAPLLPMGVAMFALAAAVRRMISPRAFAIALALLLCAHSVRGMWSPLRIDHHGWQLAMLSLVVLALVDRRPARGGLMLGLATAVSLTIGLELLIYLAAAGAIAVLMWIRDPAQAPRIAAYGASLAGGCALGYLLFASYANRAPVCDAMSPVWLSVMAGAGALCVVLAFLPASGAWPRLIAAGAGGALLAAGFLLLWPHCLGRPEGVSAELDHLWLSRVREARPVYTHGWRTALAILSLPVAGLIGYAAMLWRHRQDEEKRIVWAAVGALALLPAALLLWQTRAGPAAQLLAIPGAAALAWIAIEWAQRKRNALVAPAVIVAAFFLVSGLALQEGAALVPQEKNGRAKASDKANGLCPTLPALRAVAQQPKGVVLTFVDMGPRLISVTHHDAIAGPYHRNGNAIVDVMRAFRGSAENARRTVEKRGVDYVLICPGFSESTIYRAEAKSGFYMQLVEAKVPDWLEPVALPKDSPFKMWRVRR